MLLLASERRESNRAAWAVRVGLASGSQKREEAASGRRRRRQAPGLSLGEERQGWRAGGRCVGVGVGVAWRGQRGPRSRSSAGPRAREAY
jgi:hypothetical protein